MALKQMDNGIWKVNVYMGQELHVSLHTLIRRPMRSYLSIKQTDANYMAKFKPNEMTILSKKLQTNGGKMVIL